jgi:predicted ATP-grasp superfamily ATP-dependent carboligase
MRLLMLDEGFMSGAHTAVGLAGAGVDVTVLGLIGGRERTLTEAIDWRLAEQPRDAAHLERIIDDLAPIADVIYPVTEPLRAMAWSLSPRSRDRVYPATPAVLRPLFANKRLMADYLGGYGVPTLEQVDARRHDVLGYPCVIKGITGRGGSATRIATSARQADAAVAELGESHCFAQEFVDGETYIVGGLFDRGRALRIHAARKSMQYPARVGPASRLETVDEPALLDAALATFALLDVTGLASVDFIRRPSGQFAFLEINPRPWGSISAARDAGVDLFGPFAALLRGESPAADLSYEVGVSSSVFPLYLASRDEWRRPRMLVQCMMHDLTSTSGRIWRHPRRAAHLCRRLIHVVRDWPHTAVAHH